MTAASRISGDDMKRAKPFCPRTLAERWSCSPEKIRTMYRNGEIGGFQLGKLIRIPADEVERYECQNTPSHDTGESLPSPSESAVSCAESRLVRQSAGKQRLSPVSGGSGTPPRQANG